MEGQLGRGGRGVSRIEGVKKSREGELVLVELRELRRVERGS